MFVDAIDSPTFHKIHIPVGHDRARAVLHRRQNAHGEVGVVVRYADRVVDLRLIITEDEHAREAFTGREAQENQEKTVQMVCHFVEECAR